MRRIGYLLAKSKKSLYTFQNQEDTSVTERNVCAGLSDKATRNLHFPKDSTAYRVRCRKECPKIFWSPCHDRFFKVYIKKGYLIFQFKGGQRMKVKEGDVLICTSKDCSVELKVMHACHSKSCGVECDIEATCHKKPMELKKK